MKPQFLASDLIREFIGKGFDLKRLAFLSCENIILFARVRFDPKYFFIGNLFHFFSCICHGYPDPPTQYKSAALSIFYSFKLFLSLRVLEASNILAYKSRGYMVMAIQ